jgi:hypothetical protein
MRLHRALCFVIACGIAAPAAAADCNVNVWNAYNTAKARGWVFNCTTKPLIQGGFVPYPPPLSSVGCSFKTPTVPGVPNEIGTGYLFVYYDGGHPNLKNGWTVKSFEIAGGQWSAFTGEPARVGFRTTGPKQGGKTYNYYISKLTLTKNGGVCGNAINEAF